MPCVSKASSKHEIIMSLWLICYIQYGFSISYLFIPGITFHNWCNIPQFYFFVHFNVVLCLLFILLFFREDSKRITWYERGEGYGVIIICFKIDLLNFSHYLWSPFLFAPNRYDCYYIISISIITTIVMIIIFYTHNQYNCLITYYSFKCCLLAE